MNKLADVEIGGYFDTHIGKTVGLANLVSIFLSNAVAIAGVIMFILILLGGIGMITGAGQNDPQRIEKGKKAATYGVIGFLVIFVSYWVIQAVEIIAGFNILSPIEP